MLCLMSLCNFVYSLSMCILYIIWSFIRKIVALLRMQSIHRSLREQEPSDRKIHSQCSHSILALDSATSPELTEVKRLKLARAKFTWFLKTRKFLICNTLLINPNSNTTDPGNCFSNYGAICAINIRQAYSLWRQRYEYVSFHTFYFWSKFVFVELPLLADS
jgi:hypothetical protein